MNYRLLTYLFVIISALCGSCNTDHRVEGSKEAVEKMKSMQIKRVTDSQVIEIVDDWGKRIVKQAQLQLESALTKSVSDNSQLCLLNTLPKLDTLEKMYAVEISLLGAKDRKNPALSLTEQELINAYVYNAENQIKPVSNIQKVGDSVLIYSVPVSIGNIICQKCFPNEATHLALWHVKFRKNEVIRKVNAKSLEKKRKVS